MGNLSDPLNIYSETNTSISIIGKGQKETDVLTLKTQPKLEGPQGQGVMMMRYSIWRQLASQIRSRASVQLPTAGVAAGNPSESCGSYS